MKTIVYFHGYGSSCRSNSATCLAKNLPEYNVIAPDIPVDPAEALPFLKGYCAENKVDLIIGTSMGGMYAQQMRGFVRICINPALNMSTMSNVLRTGEHKFFNGRKDGQKTFRITRDIIQHHNKMERQQWNDITEWDREHSGDMKDRK